MATLPTPPRKTPLLDLDAFAEQPQARIDGTLYDLRMPDHLSIVEGVRIRKVAPRLEELQAKEVAGTLDEAEGEELSQILDGITRTVLVAPPEVLERLHDWQKIAVVLAFTGLSTPRLRATGATAEARSSSSPTGPSSSPNSPAPSRRSRRTRG